VPNAEPHPLVLTILREGAILSVWLTDLLPVGRPARVDVGGAALRDLRAQALEATQPGPWKAFDSAAGDVAAHRLRELGGTIFKRCFPEPIREFLRQSPTRDLYLHLDEDLLDIPWELAFDGDSVLGEKFGISRLISSAAGIPAAPAARPVRDTLRVLLVRGASVPASGDAYCAGLSQRLSAIEGLSATRVDAESLPRVEALQLLAEHDIVHVVGAVPLDAAQAGWWPSAETVSMREVAALATPPQLLISESAAAPEPGGNLRLAKEAVGSGLNLLAGESPAGGAAGLAFMEQIYRELARGGALGEALRGARAALRRLGRGEPGPWPAALLYGDAARVIFPHGQRAPREHSRRQVTVMSCDMVESTRLLKTLGAETYSDVLARYRSLCTSIVSRHGGFVEDPKGDGILCFFGFPVAKEDSAMRSLRAGRDIIDAVDGLGVRVRIGIDTGQVAVSEGKPVGDAVHFATRLQAHAEPGTMRVSESTRQIVKGRFEFRLIEGAQDFKGFDDPKPVYVAIGETRGDGADPFEAAPRLTPFTGRGRELQLIGEHWSSALKSGVRTVLVSGDAGIGKSRLVREFRRSQLARGNQAIECRCVPEHTTSAFHPVVDLLRRLLRIQDGDGIDAKLDKIEASLLPAGTAALVASLLSLPFETRYPKLQLPAEKQRQLTLNALINWIKRETGKTPVCLIVEDIHWIDPSSLEFLNRLVAEAAHLPLLVIATLRSESAHDWNPAFSAHRIELGGLSPESSRAMVMGACGDSKLPGEIVRLLAARADGVPLFIEESTRMALDLGVGAEGRDAASTLRFAVPATIQDLLMARLDRLASAKPVAQLGGTIGREFSFALLEAVLSHESSPVRVGDLAAQLAVLVKSGLLIEKGDMPATSYFFKHALARDAAYQSLWERDRKRLHRAIATVIAEKFGDLEENQPELLAYHYTEAGIEPEAIAYWERAARRAASRSAHYEAISHLKNGLGLLARQPDSPARDRSELRSQLLLAGWLIATEGYGAEQVERVYARASDLCRKVGDEGALLKAQLGLEGYHFMRANFAKAYAIADQVATKLIGAADVRRRLQSNWAVAHVLFHKGDIVSAVERMDACHDEYDRTQHHPDAVQDLGVMCLCYSSWGKWELGYPDQALQRAEKVVALASALDHRFSMGEAYGFRAAVRHFRGENDAARQDAELAIKICEDHGFAVWLAHAKLMHGRAVAELGEPAAGIREMREAYDMWSATGAVATTPFYLALQAEGLALAGRPDEGLALLEKAIAIIGKCGERYYEAEIRRLYGELILQSAAPRRLDRGDEAKAWFLGGLEAAEAMKLRSLKLRSAFSLGRLWMSRERREEAAKVLAPAYAWFTEGKETRDLTRARALLQELQAGGTAREGPQNRKGGSGGKRDKTQKI